MDKDFLRELVVAVRAGQAEGIAAVKDQNPRAYQDLVSFGPILLSQLFLKRKLKKLGFDERERFLIFSGLTALAALQRMLFDIRKELRTLNDREAPASAPAPTDEG